MNKLKIALLVFPLFAIASCGQTTQKDNTTNASDTMVIKQDKTDSATNTISTDTTKR